MPKRIQRQRKKGWRMPEGAVYVGRGSIWGNPFVPGQPCGVFPEGMGLHGKAETLIPELTLEKAIHFYRELLRGHISPEMYPAGHNWSRDFHKRCGGHPSEIARAFLRGKDLACWCSTDQPCHADVLIEIANR